MTSKTYETMDEVIEIVKGFKDRSFKEIDISSRMDGNKNKGRIGHVIEEGLFRYAINSAQEPDIKGLDLEIKSAGYRYVSNGNTVSAKERLVITMIDFMRDPEIEFKHSHLYQKIKNLLILLYEYKPDMEFGDYVLADFIHYQFDKIPEIDQHIILKDYETILGKIRLGKAHELSESDTNYLGACPKGANRNSLTRQPNNPILAMRRTYALKSTYMTALLRKELNKAPAPQLIKSASTIKNKTLESYVADIFSKYVGLKLSDIDQKLGITINRGNKSYLYDYASKMLNVNLNDLDNIDEFNKANIKLKTIRITTGNRIKESMSFPTFDFVELSKEDWDASKIKLMFEETKFLFVVFREIDDSKHEYVFAGTRFWNMPTSLLNSEVKRVWARTKKILNTKLDATVASQNHIESNFPGSSDSTILHVRPHGRDAWDTLPLPRKCTLRIKNENESSRAVEFIRDHKYTKQCFWLNSGFILSIVKDI